jgi:hypothetical protein
MDPRTQAHSRAQRRTAAEPGDRRRRDDARRGILGQEATVASSKPSLSLTTFVMRTTHTRSTTSARSRLKAKRFISKIDYFDRSLNYHSLIRPTRLPPCA